MNLVSSKVLIFCIVMFLIEIGPVVYEQKGDQLLFYSRQ